MCGKVFHTNNDRQSKRSYQGLFRRYEAGEHSNALWHPGKKRGLKPRFFYRFSDFRFCFGGFPSLNAVYWIRGIVIQKRISAMLRAHSSGEVTP